MALNDGPTFGPGGEGCVRFNFGCPRPTMMQALGQMRDALLLPPGLDRPTLSLLQPGA